MQCLLRENVLRLCIKALIVHRVLSPAQIAPVEIGLFMVLEVPYLALSGAFRAAVEGEGF
jgi:hypothetical protein